MTASSANLGELKPLNDNILVEVTATSEDLGAIVVDKGDEGYQTGIVVDVADDLIYYGSNSWVLESTLFDTKRLAQLREFYAKLKGKRVYWEAFASSGQLIEKDNKTYAIIKMSRVIAMEK